MINIERRLGRRSRCLSSVGQLTRGGNILSLLLTTVKVLMHSSIVDEKYFELVILSLLVHLHRVLLVASPYSSPFGGVLLTPVTLV